ncbi:MAG TPA: hypothetical protein VOA87_03370 [Thermoanaerobaculia bacterium]|nr:hypothetical protein [Thermoanaerobaculia bacterium]
MPPKDAAKTKAKNAAPQTPCDRGPDTDPVVKVTVTAGQPVSFDLFYCFTPGNMIVRLDDQVLMNQPVPPPATVHVDVAPLSPGLHTLSWLFHPVSINWKAVSEVSVGGSLKRRQTDDNTTSPLHLVLDSVFLEVK